MAKKKEIYENNLKEMRKKIELQNEKQKGFEQHVEKITKQNNQLSEYKIRTSELMEETLRLRSKVKFMEKNGGMQFSGSIGMSRMPSTTTQLNGANFGGMEDEAGEEFNNTYLNQLKTGGSEVSLDTYSSKELQKRNSMHPQHMRSSYAMHQVDHVLSEKEIKVRQCINRGTKLNTQILF
jgi:hypothetical protein